MKKNTLLYGICLILILSSCGIQKRQHTRGFYMPSLGLHKSTGTTENLKKESFRQTADKFKNQVGEPEGNVALAFKAEDPALIEKTESKKYAFEQNQWPKKDSCDEIVMTNGDFFYGKIFEVSSTEVRYFACDYLTGPIQSIEKNKVLLIQYVNGKKEVVNTGANANDSISGKNGKYGTYGNPIYKKSKAELEREIVKDKNIAWTGFALSFLSFILPIGIASIILGIIAVRRRFRSKAPKMKKIGALGVFTIVLSIIGLAIISIFIISEL